MDLQILKTLQNLFMLIGCGFRLPAGVLNLQVQQIPRRNQKSSRGVRYKPTHAGQEPAETKNNALRGPFY